MKNSKKTVLFLPFLQIASGHHQVANALMDRLQKLDPTLKCEKRDILAYSYGAIENLVSQIYIKWFSIFPQFYNKIYRNTVYKDLHNDKRFRLYELLFLPFMRKLIAEIHPDLIVCTHSLPAYALNLMKGRGEMQTPVVNVYTDFFVHRLWGVQYIDCHLVPSVQIKTFLMKKGVRDEQIFVTGIPVHNMIKKQEKPLMSSSSNLITVLISGGNLGVGAIDGLIEEFLNDPNKNLKLIVLCGKNEELYKKLISLNHQQIQVHSFIDKMERMNDLYDKVDAIVTKPGGVTISECMYKRKPIFIYHALPGQEQINLENLKKEGLVFHLKKEKVFEQIYSMLSKKSMLQNYHQIVEEYHQEINGAIPEQIMMEYL
ncbi:MGDG synthase family glycosyltransferase [Robertmurraya massiliosenegalensis]|uniref:MGDG synthase family glycosyltransferase n=1 Tax=Robertmurraya massiliosenegalensis TaxID=1287657 RepID=UPI0003200448|nr:glycosyltransferase [Robertmurraya massiliosenegalensis]